MRAGERGEDREVGGRDGGEVGVECFARVRFGRDGCGGEGAEGVKMG